MGAHRQAVVGRGGLRVTMMMEAPTRLGPDPSEGSNSLLVSTKLLYSLVLCTNLSMIAQPRFRIFLCGSFIYLLLQLTWMHHAHVV